MPGSRAASLSSARAAGIWRAWRPERRVAAVAALLLAASTAGPFSFVEAAEILTAAAVLVLLVRRAEGDRFRLPVADGTAIAVAGGWAALLILARMLDRPLGQNLLALACAALMVAAGLRERAGPSDERALG